MVQNYNGALPLSGDRRVNVVLPLTKMFLFGAGSLLAAYSLAKASYDIQTNVLTIPWVSAEGNTYSNVRLHVDRVLRLNQTFTSSIVEYYDSKYNELYIGEVDVNGTPYKGVVVRPGVVLSVGGAGVAPNACGTPTFDYVAPVGNYTMSTNLWGIRGSNTWDTWRAEDFSMCLEGRSTVQSGIEAVAAEFSWKWPLESYVDPRKPITKNFATINYTPGGKPMKPVSLKETSLVLFHDISQRGAGNNQTFYDLYAGTSSAPLDSIFGTNFDGAINISIRIFSSTGYEGKDEAIYRNVQIDGRSWTVRTNGRSWIQFMISNDYFPTGSVKLREFISFMKSINFQADMDNYFLKSIELGNEQIDGTGGLSVRNFYVRD